MANHEDIKLDLSLYALGSLDPDEQRTIEQHLADGCAECAAELQAWRDVVGLVPLEVYAAGAPDLKGQLLQRVRAGAGTAAASPAARVARRRIGWAMPLAAAALALLAIATYREIGWRADADRLARRVADLQQALNRTSGDLDRIRTVLADREQDVAALRSALAQAEASASILHSRGLNLVALKETKDAPPAAGHVLLSPPTGRALFYAFDLPQVPNDKTYELWWITEKDGPVQAGIFRPDARGIGRIEATLPTNAGAIQAAAVTVEAAGGVAKPQGPMVLLGAVTPS